MYCKYLVFQCGFSVIGVCTVIISCVSYRYRTFGILAEEEHSLLCWEYSFVTVRYVHCCKVCDCIIGVIWYSFIFYGLFALGW